FFVTDSSIPVQSDGTTVKYMIKCGTTSASADDTYIYSDGKYGDMSGTAFSYIIGWGVIIEGQYDTGGSDIGYSSWTNCTTPDLKIKQSPPSVGDKMSFKLQVDNVSDFSSPAIDYVSDSMDAGTVTYRVGQSDIAYPYGTYMAGASGDTLGEGSYYWRARSSVTVSGSTSPWANANGGGIAFKVDINNPAQVRVTALQSADGLAKIDLSWTASSDTGSGVKNYSIYRATFSFSDYTKATDVVAVVEDTNYTDSGTAMDKIYYYGVRAQDKANNWSSLSTLAEVDTTKKTIDGDPADWSGTAASIKNSATVSNGEWIWTDKTGEMRTNSPQNDDVDIKELRVTSDENNLYFLAEFSDINDKLYPNLGLTIGESNTDITEIGDDSGTSLGDEYYGTHYAQKSIVAHYNDTAATWVIELSDDGTDWSTSTLVAFNITDNTIEFKLSKSELGISSGETTVRITAASFYQSQSNWDADSSDITTDYSPPCDALDSMSIAKISTGSSAGQYYNDKFYTMNASTEDLSDGDIDFWADIYISPLYETENNLPETVDTPYPPDQGEVSISSPTLSFASGSDSDVDEGDTVTSYLLELSTYSSDLDGKVTYRVNLATTNWLVPENIGGSDNNYWRVRARDKRGTLSAASTWTFRSNAGNDSPYAPSQVELMGWHISDFIDSAPETVDDLQAQVSLSDPADR
ncbi:MAG: hypothetical protein PF545_07170, partial [Elusimicrobia bacterium]|nr:hypothetical protein [Elusimicrobiota bacterium]